MLVFTIQWVLYEKYILSDGNLTRGGVNVVKVVNKNVFLEERAKVIGVK